jgi:hypothetical protein
MIHSYAKFFGLISLSVLVLIWCISELKYIIKSYIFTELAFFALRICLILTPSLSLRKTLALTIATPASITIMFLSVVQIGNSFNDSLLTPYILALDLLFNIVLLHTTYTQTIKSPFNRYIYTEFSLCNYKHNCSICLFPIVAFQDYASLACDHSYHIQCINDWFERQTVSCIVEDKLLQITCPLCRFDPYELDKTIYDMSNADDSSTNPEI